MEIDLNTIDGDELLELTQKSKLSEFKKQINKALDRIDLEISVFDTLIGLQKNLYWKAQDIQKLIFLTEKIDTFVNSHPDGSPRNLSSIYYNLASFTCPWWSDSLEITKEQAEIGFKAAERVAELRTKKNFPTIKISGGYWILGCHYLYTKKDYDKAVKYFYKSKEEAESVPEDNLSYLLVGNSIEGIGRAKELLRTDLNGKDDITEAMKIYKNAEDDYSTGEAEVFLDSL